MIHSASYPVITIITVVFNGAKVLEGTVQSVLQQTYPRIEYLIIDGGSTDGTVAMIKKYESKIAHWVSEKDKGIYDAMNKGIKMAKGEYLLFLNAGDELYDSNTVNKIFETGSPHADVYYGETALVNSKGEILGTRSALTTRKLPPALSWRNMSKGMVVSHQSFIVKKSIAPFYNLQYHYAADIDWVISCLKNSTRVVNTGQVVSKFLTGGFSQKNHLESLIDRFRVLKKHFGAIPAILNHFSILLRGIFFKIRS